MSYLHSFTQVFLLAAQAALSRGFELSKFCLCCAVIAISLSTNVSAQQSEQHDWHYTYRPSDTLQDVAKRLLNNQHKWPELVRYNRIKNPDNIRPGSIIKVPMTWLKFQPVPANALSVDGDVLLKKARSNGYKPLIASTKLMVGDELMSRNGSALIQLADQSIIRLERNSHIRFNKLSHYGETGMVDTRIRLHKGSLINQVAPLKKGSRYEVSTPSAVAAVRGTEFRISASAQGTQLEVTKGEVLLSSASGSQLVPAGQGASVKVQRAQIERHRLLPAPEPDTVAKQITSLPATLSWRSQSGAERYKYVLVSREQGKVFVVDEGQLTKPELELDHLRNGEYELAMRAVDAKGFEGLSNISALNIQQSGEAAELKSPADGQTVALAELGFEWQQADKASSQFQLARDGDFARVLIDTDFKDAEQFQLADEQTLAPGEYYWRVLSLNHGQIETPSETRRFILRGELGKAQILSVNYVKNQAGLFWNKVALAESYLLQIASDPDFNSVLREQEITKTSAFLKLKHNQDYYARVKALNKGPYDSEFGPSTLLNFDQGSTN